MHTNIGEFRFAYFTEKYDATCAFYAHKLELELLFSWERNENDKGSVFKAGDGCIEILHLPEHSEEHTNAGLDYKTPQGAFMVIQVEGVDKLYKTYKSKGLTFKQHITNQSWGHRSFSIRDPNGIVLFMYEPIHSQN